VAFGRRRSWNPAPSQPPALAEGSQVPNAEPAAPAHIGRPEEPDGLGGDELGLGTRRSGTPQVGKPVVVMAVDPQRQELTPRKKSRRPMAQFLGHAG